MNDFLVVSFDNSIKDMRPMVYLINKNMMPTAVALAQNAIEDWYNQKGNCNIVDLIEEKWRLFHIWYHQIGTVKLSYQNRQRDYLSENIRKVVL